VVDRIAAGEDDAAVIVQGNALLSEILSGYTFYFYKRGKVYFQLIFFGKVEIGRLGSFRLRLGDKYILDLAVRVL
jgi:hypothetical protein